MNSIAHKLKKGSRADDQGAGKAGPQPAVADSGFLPDFCGAATVLNVIVLAQFVAIVFTIVTPDLSGNIFVDLFLISLFVQWIALMSISVLCLARPYLNQLSERRALLMAYLLLLCVTWSVGEGALWTLATFDYISSARPVWYAYFHGQNLTVSAIINALAMRYFVARHQLRSKTLSEERARSEILRQRIRPHFLFNSMNIIASLTQRAPTKAENAIEDMAELFRLMLDESKDLVSVHSEISIARKYTKLEKLRLERRLSVHWDTQSVPRAARTPVLILQLLLENAVHYGIEQLTEGGEIHVRISMDDQQRLEIAVEHPLPARLGEEDPAEGAALENIRLRLRDHYGDTARMDIEQDGRTFRTHISHPALGALKA